MKYNYSIVKTVMAAAAILFLVSCNRNGMDPEQGGGENTPTEESRFWDVVGQLVDYRDITEDYKGKTFKAIIGTPDGGDESVRVVAVNDLGTAVENYNTLVGASITPTTPSHTFTDKAVGTLTWNLTGDNTSWGTVDVNIPAVPGLRKIVYRSGEQGDVNGSVGNNGSAYYRFGDVIERKQGGVTEYWICVRPAFGPEDKGKSHWVCVSPLPKANLWPLYKQEDAHVASNDMSYALPYNLRTETKWHQDLAELLFAIMYPHEWITNATNYYHVNKWGTIDGLRIFHDFKVGNIAYHNEAFWSQVRMQWKEKDLVQKIFGISYEQMEQAISPYVQNPTGIHLLYKGHEWTTWASNKPKLFEAHYTHGTDNTEKNMHKQTLKSVVSQVVEPNNKTETNTNYSLNFYTRQSNAQPYIVEPRFFGDDARRWTVRYAEGVELSSTGNFDPQQPLPGFPATTAEVYRYYRDVFSAKNLTDAPEVTETGGVNDKDKQRLQAFDGIGHYGFGDVFTDQSGFHWFVVRPSGGSEADNPLTEKSPYAELVSFEGIIANYSKQVANTAATKEQILRVSMPLWHLCLESYNHAESVNHNAYKVFNNVKEHANVDLRHLMQEVAIKRYQEDNAKGGTELCSFAYYEPGSTKQHLMRYITERGPGNSFITVMYDKYPKESTTENIYPELTSVMFSDTPVYLQDVADMEKINAYARDYMAMAPFMTEEMQPREVRKEAEARASDITNYIYSKDAWDAKTQPLGMWNEPVLFLRVTAVYDRGDYEGYATMTVDGYELTLVSRGLRNQNETPDNPYMWLGAAQTYNQAQDRHINGVQQAIPTWQAVWGTN